MKKTNQSDQAKSTLLKIPLPQAPTEKTLANPALTFSDATGGVLVTYCPQTSTGAVYFRVADMWRIFSPISPQEFLRAILQQGLEFPSEYVEAAWSSEIGASNVH